MPETWQIAIIQKMQKIPRSQNFVRGSWSTEYSKRRTKEGEIELSISVRDRTLSLLYFVTFKYFTSVNDCTKQMKKIWKNVFSRFFFIFL